MTAAPAIFQRGQTHPEAYSLRYLVDSKQRREKRRLRRLQRNATHLPTLRIELAPLLSKLRLGALDVRLALARLLQSLLEVVLVGAQSGQTPREVCVLITELPFPVIRLKQNEYQSIHGEESEK